MTFSKASVYATIIVLAIINSTTSGWQAIFMLRRMGVRSGVNCLTCSNSMA